MVIIAVHIVSASVELYTLLLPHGLSLIAVISVLKRTALYDLALRQKVNVQKGIGKAAGSKFNEWSKYCLLGG